MLRTDNHIIPIGIIPGGSGNSFLYDLNDKNPLSVFKDILLFKKRSIDVIKIQTIYPLKRLRCIMIYHWAR